jgi:hypothetical protein
VGRAGKASRKEEGGMVGGASARNGNYGDDGSYVEAGVASRKVRKIRKKEVLAEPAKRRPGARRSQEFPAPGRRDYRIGDAVNRVCTQLGWILI